MTIKNIVILLVTLSLGVLSFLMLFKSTTQAVFCEKKVQFQLYKFMQAVKKNGADQKVELNNDIGNFLRKIYANCIQE